MHILERLSLIQNKSYANYAVKLALNNKYFDQLTRHKAKITEGDYIYLYKPEPRMGPIQRKYTYAEKLSTVKRFKLMFEKSLNLSGSQSSTPQSHNLQRWSQ